MQRGIGTYRRIIYTWDFSEMSHVRVEEIQQSMEIPWMDIFICGVIITLIVLKFKT
jgi:hypothetical protein